MENNNNRIIQLINAHGAFMAFMVALIATLGSLYFSEVMHFIPCTYCWYQRILMYPLVLVTLVGIIERDEFLPKYVLPLSLIGLGLSTYHYLVQWGIVSQGTACGTGVPCSGRYINWGGFITIPLMALVAFFLISLIMFIQFRSRSSVEEI